MAKHITCAETAKLVRQALKESFPGTKFSVKSSTYSMGASITVTWTDGPNEAQVQSVTSNFVGSYLDGSIDYRGSRYHKLDGEEVRFASDSVHLSRKYSDVQTERAIKLAHLKHDAPIVSLQEYHHGDAWRLMDGDYCRYVRNLLAKLSDRANVAESATLKRVQEDGDDGYGQGTVGRNGSGSDNAAKGMQQAREHQAAAQRAAEQELTFTQKIFLALIPAAGGVQ